MKSKFLAGLLLLGSVGPIAVATEKPAEDAWSSPQIVTKAQTEAFRGEVEPSLLAKGEPKGSEDTDAEAFAPGWYCQATSAVTGLTYFWLSYNLPYSRYMALSACQTVNGFTCVVNCTLSY